MFSAVWTEAAKSAASSKREVSPSPRTKYFPIPLASSHKSWYSKNFQDRFRTHPRTHRSKTITSHMHKDGHANIHYDPRQNRRQVQVPSCSWGADTGGSACAKAAVPVCVCACVCVQRLQAHARTRTRWVLQTHTLTHAHMHTCTCPDVTWESLAACWLGQLAMLELVLFHEEATFLMSWRSGIAADI